MCTLFASVLAGLTLAAGAAPGADLPPASTPRPATQHAVAVHHLTNDSLLTMLQGMGYEPKVLKGPMYEIKAGQWVIHFSLSKNRENLWLTALLAKLPEGRPIPAQRLLTLLSDNLKIDPIHFGYATPSRFITLSMRLENRDLTVKEVRNALDTFAETISRTIKDWAVPQWSEFKSTAGSLSTSRIRSV